MSQKSLGRSTEVSLKDRMKEIESKMDSYIRRITNNSRRRKIIKGFARHININNFSSVNRIKHLTNEYPFHLYRKLSIKDILSAYEKDLLNINMLKDKESSRVFDILLSYGVNIEGMTASLNSFNNSLSYYIDLKIDCIQALIDVEAFNLLLLKRIHTMKYIKNEAKNHKLIRPYF